MSVKFQFALPGPLLADLKRLARKEKLSVAGLIRQTMKGRVRSHDRRSKVDPFQWITGLLDSGDRTLASQIDQILYR